MKMKMKMTLVAGALALAVAGQANAAIVTGTTGASNLILQIWDSANNTSYTKDLGLSITSFLSGVTGTNTALTASSAGVTATPFAADALLSGYLATANAAALVWNVTAVDNFSATAPYGFQAKQLLTTTSVNIKSAGNSLASAAQNAQVNTAINVLDTTLINANGAAGTATSVTAGAADAWIAKPNALNTSLAFNTTGTLGSTLNFWYVTPSSTSGIGKASVAQFNGGASAATWSLDAAGNLTFANGAPAVAPVPEPGEWLLMLSGLALIGFIATRRKDEGSMTFA